MFKKTAFGLLISAMSISSYSYSVRTTFTIENKTDTDMKIAIDQPRGQAPIYQMIPAHKTTPITNNNGVDYIENGDHSGALNQTLRAPFRILDKEGTRLLVNGQVVYHVQPLLWNRSSFLDSVTAAEGLKTDQQYSCRFGGANNIFNNKIVIEGNALKTLTSEKVNENPGCNGVKSSSVSKDYHYWPVCNDPNEGNPDFWQYAYSERCYSTGCKAWITYYDGKEFLPVKIIMKSYSVSIKELKTAMDKVACGSRL